MTITRYASTKISPLEGMYEYTKPVTSCSFSNPRIVEGMESFRCGSLVKYKYEYLSLDPQHPYKKAKHGSRYSKT